MTNPNDPANSILKCTNCWKRGPSKDHGLTKREYFAGLAMQGIFSRYVSNEPQTLVRLAVDMADALIAELNK